MTVTIDERGNMGSRSFRVGTLTATQAQTSEDINTELNQVIFMAITLTNTTVADSSATIINESLPAAGNAVTVLVPTGTGTRTYKWIAVGY